MEPVLIQGVVMPAPASTRINCGGHPSWKPVWIPANVYAYIDMCGNESIGSLRSYQLYIPTYLSENLRYQPHVEGYFDD